jgi:molecular chaperone GrpE (heat shock protein)
LTLVFFSFLQIAELKAKLDQTQESLRQKKSRLEHYEKTAKQQQLDMKKRITQIGDLNKVMNIIDNSK